MEKIDGFISIERFSSLVEEGKVLSLSFWRDEGAIKEWRSHMEHRAAQDRGRQEIFTDYRIRVMSLDRIRIDRTHMVGSIDPVNPVYIYKVEQIHAVDGIADGDSNQPRSALVRDYGMYDRDQAPPSTS